MEFGSSYKSLSFWHWKLCFKLGFPRKQLRDTLEHAGAGSKVTRKTIIICGSELVRRFLSSGSESIDREPMPDYQHMFTEEYVKELARMAASLSGSMNQPTQNATSYPFSPKINPSQTKANYNVGPAASSPNIRI